MAAIRVLVVDDSAAVRRLVSEVLAKAPGIAVAGTASSGAIALARLPELAPDVVTLDVDMEGLSGLETLRRIRAANPDLPVLMFSALTHRGAEATIDALLLGASDYVTKPSGSGSREEALASVRDQLVPRIRALVKSAPGVAPTARATAGRAPVDVVVVGVSTGGPNALMAILPRLPRDLPVPVLLVQHLPPEFTRSLVAAFEPKCALRVVAASDGDVADAGRIIFAPGGRHLELARGAAGEPARVRLSDAPPENSCRPAADVLFRSAARVHGPGVLAVVLTGMGQDGLRGSEAVREAGGAVLAQDESTSVVWGMPGSVVRAGLADAVLPLDELAPEIVNRARARVAGAR